MQLRVIVVIIKRPDPYLSDKAMVFRLEGYESDEEMWQSIQKQLPANAEIKDYWTVNVKSLGI